MKASRAGRTAAFPRVRVSRGSRTVGRPASAPARKDSSAPGLLKRVRRMLVVIAPVLLVATVVGWEKDAPEGSVHLVPLLAAAPAVAVVGSGRRICVVGSGACALLALGYLRLGETHHHHGSRFAVLVSILCVVGAGCLVAERRNRLKRELARVREVATVAQDAVLRPPPPRLDGVTIAAGHLSATREASLGGDLYDVAATPFGLRVVMGDVRGHGLAAVGTVAAMLGSFREAAHDEPHLGGVLRRMERGLLRQQDGSGEEFVTVQLLELCGDGSLTVHNCGHPWPYWLSAPGYTPPRAQPVGDAEPLPPLGLFPLPARLPVPLRMRVERGETLLLFTDGVEDARDADGTHFTLDGILGELLSGGVPPAPAELVAGVRAAVLRHTGGHFTDDVALLAIRNDRPALLGSQPAPAAAESRPVSVPRPR